MRGQDLAAKTAKLTVEIAKGSLAMMTFIGMFFQDGLTAFALRDWALYSAVPLRAFENKLGMQVPLGFWDPAGFAVDGSAENFSRHRQTEIKHDHVDMRAAMGYITPEITDKRPGRLSSTTGLKFADVPNGVATIFKVPVAGLGSDPRLHTPHARTSSRWRRNQAPPLLRREGGLLRDLPGPVPGHCSLRGRLPLQGDDLLGPAATSSSWPVASPPSSRTGQLVNRR